MSNLVLWNSQGYGFLEYRLKELGFAEFTKLKWFLFLTASGKFDTLHAGNYNHFFFWKGTEHLSQTLYLYSLLLALQPDILNCKLCRPDSQIVKVWNIKGLLHQVAKKIRDWGKCSVLFITSSDGEEMRKVLQ